VKPSKPPPFSLVVQAKKKKTITNGGCKKPLGKTAKTKKKTQPKGPGDPQQKGGLCPPPNTKGNFPSGEREPKNG